MIFRSDNTAGVSPQILQALANVNPGYEQSYGGDQYTKKLTELLSDLFKRKCHVLLCTSGTAANAIAIAALTPVYGHCLCYEAAHIRVDECNAIQMTSGGGNLWPIEADDAKITNVALESAVARQKTSVHMGKISALSLTQATERGTVYKVDELSDLCEIAHRTGLHVHMDGARFANALVTTGASPAEMSWKAGVDLLTFGSAKNGTFSAEALIAFDERWVEELSFLQKRMGQLTSKMRFQAAQMIAYLEDDLWLRNARHGNEMARLLADGIQATGIGKIQFDVDANMIFWRTPSEFADALARNGFSLLHSTEGDHSVLRLVTAFDVKTEDVSSFIELCSGLAEPTLAAVS